MARFLRLFSQFFFFVAGACLLWFAVSYGMYRIPSGRAAQVFNGEVHYKVLELSLSNREFFEHLLGNRIVRMNGQPMLFAKPSDVGLLWVESPFDMMKKNYTLRARFKAAPLFFGGYSLAEIVSTERLDKAPSLSK